MLCTGLAGSGTSAPLRPALVTTHIPTAMSTTATSRTAIKIVARATSFVSPSSALAALSAGLPTGDGVATPVGTDAAGDGEWVGDAACWVGDGDGVGPEVGDGVDGDADDVAGDDVGDGAGAGVGGGVGDGVGDGEGGKVASAGVGIGVLGGTVGAAVVGAAVVGAAVVGAATVSWVGVGWDWPVLPSPLHPGNLGPSRVTVPASLTYSHRRSSSVTLLHATKSMVRAR